MIESFILLLFLALVCEYTDSTLGMGYGTIMTPILIMLGYSVTTIVPCVLFTEMITGITAGYFHHEFKNTDFRPGSNSSKVAITLILCSVVGSIFAVVLALSLPAIFLKIWIGVIIIAMGITILVTRGKEFPFSWKKIIGLGSLAAFNKGVSGGGYGPLVTSGQMLSGIRGKHAIGITSLAEGVTCIFGFIIYMIFQRELQWNLAIPLLIGGLISVPISAWTISKINVFGMKRLVGLATTLLGILTLVKISLKLFLI